MSQILDALIIQSGAVPEYANHFYEESVEPTAKLSVLPDIMYQFFVNVKP